MQMALSWHVLESVGEPNYHGIQPGFHGALRPRRVLPQESPQFSLTEVSLKMSLKERIRFYLTG